MLHAIDNDCSEIVEILAPFCNNPNAVCRNERQVGKSLMFLAVERRYTNVIKLWAPMLVGNNPDSLIRHAINKDYSEIVEILAPFCTNPNATGPDGYTSLMFLAAEEGYANAIKVSD